MNTPRETSLSTPLSIALVLVVAGGTAFAAPVKGKLELATSAADLDATPHHVRAQNGLFPTVERLYEPSRVVTVALTAEGAEDPVACPARLENGGLVPETLVGAPGAELTLANGDGTDYAPVADGLAGLGGAPLAPGGSVSATLPGEGSFEVRDLIYPHVTGRVVVLPGLVACATVDNLGAFRFEQVAPGEYSLHVFVDGEALDTRPVVVPPPGYGPLTLPPISLSGAR